LQKNLEASPRASWLASVSTDPMVPARMYMSEVVDQGDYIYMYIIIYIWGFRQNINPNQPCSWIMLDQSTLADHVWGEYPHPQQLIICLV
jgi:hypothetical protein